MPFELIIDVLSPTDGRVYVRHSFFGETEADARESFAQHAKGCEFLQPAIAEGRTEEADESGEIDEDEWPAYDDDDEPDVDDEEDEEAEDEEEGE